MDDVKLIWSIRDAKTSLTTLLQRGQIGDDLWERFLLAEKELESEIVEVVGEANTFEPGYGQRIFAHASDMVSHERWKEIYRDIPQLRAEERESTREPRRWTHHAFDDSRPASDASFDPVVLSRRATYRLWHPERPSPGPDVVLDAIFAESRPLEPAPCSRHLAGAARSSHACADNRAALFQRRHVGAAESRHDAFTGSAGDAREAGSRQDARCDARHCGGGSDSVGRLVGQGHGRVGTRVRDRLAGGNRRFAAARPCRRRRERPGGDTKENADDEEGQEEASGQGWTMKMREGCFACLSIVPGESGRINTAVPALSVTRNLAQHCVS